jgi:CheY-like chemotaxis protein
LVLGQEEIHVARDGFAGVEKAHECDPDLILMDLNLPKMNGWDATRSLKSNPRFERVPILAITADTMLGDRERALKAGCNDYYAKPIEVDEFIHFMRPYLYRSKLTSSSISCDHTCRTDDHISDRGVVCAR